MEKYWAVVKPQIGVKEALNLLGGTHECLRTISKNFVSLLDCKVKKIFAKNEDIFGSLLEDIEFEKR